jgi:hypothetical protein
MNRKFLIALTMFASVGCVSPDDTTPEPAGQAPEQPTATATAPLRGDLKGGSESNLFYCADDQPCTLTSVCIQEGGTPTNLHCLTNHVCCIPAQ